MNVKEYFRNLAKIFQERLQGILLKTFPVSLSETILQSFRNIFDTEWTS